MAVRPAATAVVRSGEVARLQETILSHEAQLIAQLVTSCVCDTLLLKSLEQSL